MLLSDESRYVAGVLLITIVTIEFGGWFMTKIVRGQVPMTDFQKAFARAGHAHAGVLVTLGLICQVLADATTLSGAADWVARLGVPAAAILMSGGFFASSAGRGITQPNRFFWVLWLGAAALAAGTVTLGVGLLIA
ncbi:hypothetical protein [Phytohabitans houttuyneae]|uniref:Integral membrane protein n=1 Tax=Phytohabitans houttuyneae TaxID=1076126 RepID=A0A6V8K4N3_9ACTN|nr:hypothetical protein [Phytohabitans houttuyneae]GFJ76727.1 hypothetical protein Phou_009070 [Phytohabitans houttuyneae]